MAAAGPGYAISMGDREHTRQPAEEVRLADVDAVPDEEDMNTADVRDELVQEPTEHVNRPDQADFDPAEREQYEQPLDEAERHEDR